MASFGPRRRTLDLDTTATAFSKVLKQGRGAEVIGALPFRRPSTVAGVDFPMKTLKLKKNFAGRRRQPAFPLDHDKRCAMKDTWQDVLSCAVACARCNAKMTAEAPRILSVYDHLAICTACKNAEENRPDYADVSREMIGQCLIDTEAMYGDPGGYCYHHFYPYRCKD